MYNFLKLLEGRQAHRGTGGSASLMDNVSALSLHPVLVLGRGRREAHSASSHGTDGHTLGEPGGGMCRGAPGHRNGAMEPAPLGVLTTYFLLSLKLSHCEEV